jgi:hypothetical protein
MLEVLADDALQRFLFPRWIFSIIQLRIGQLAPVDLRRVQGAVLRTSVEDGAIDFLHAANALFVEDDKD